MKLPASFFARPAEQVAPELLGTVLARRFDDGRLVRARIVETEAYVGPHDLASHARFGKTARNAVMFGPPGHAYVFLIYGMYSCLNVVTLPGTAVLLRALALAGADHHLMRGPGKLCRALEIDRRWNGESFHGSRLWLAAGPPLERRVTVTARIGVDYAGGWAKRRLRFYLAGHPAVSGPKELRR